MPGQSPAPWSTPRTSTCLGRCRTGATTTTHSALGVPATPASTGEPLPTPMGQPRATTTSPHIRCRRPSSTTTRRTNPSCRSESRNPQLVCGEGSDGAPAAWEPARGASARRGASRELGGLRGHGCQPSENGDRLVSLDLVSLILCPVLVGSSWADHSLFTASNRIAPMDGLLELRTKCSVSRLMVSVALKYEESRNSAVLGGRGSSCARRHLDPRLRRWAVGHAFDNHDDHDDGHLDDTDYGHAAAGDHLPLLVTWGQARRIAPSDLRHSGRWHGGPPSVARGTERDRERGQPP